MGEMSTSRGRSVLAVSAAFTSVATLLVIIRIYTRAIMVKQMGSDDYAILVSLVGIPGLLVHSARLADQAQAFSWAFFGLFVGG